jgi:hypothetical protein
VAGALAPGAARRSAPIRRRLLWPIRHGSAARRTADSRRPSGSPGSEWPRPCTGVLPHDEPNAASIGAGATRDAIARPCRAGRAQGPRASAATSSPTRSKTGDPVSGDADAFPRVSRHGVVGAVRDSRAPVRGGRGRLERALSRPRGWFPALGDRVLRDMRKSTRLKRWMHFWRTTAGRCSAA